MSNQSPLEILIATSNVGKVREIREALSSLPLRLRQLDEFPNVSSIDETGQTYEENARLKALGYAKQTGICALADDSGLEVAALNGRPGVRSARYGDEGFSDRERTEKLLIEISHLADSNRRARFVCSMVLAGWQPTQMDTQANPQLLHVTEGTCDGVLASSARGENGFGFDPIFIPSGYDQTFAELAQHIKNRISHRARALQAMRQFLFDWLSKLDPSCARP